jgi:hypothetical protein
MALVDDVKLLKASRGQPFESETRTAALNVIEFLDEALFGCHPWFFPRGYYYDVTWRGYEQLCFPENAQSAEEAPRRFASDVATGFLEELCDILDSQRAARIRSGLGL